MLARFCLVFISLLLLLSTAPRAHCLCHDNDVFVVSATSLDCCKDDVSYKVTAGMSNINGDSCFVSTFGSDQAAGVGLTIPGRVVLAIQNVWSAQQPSFMDDAQSLPACTRAPPSRHPPGIALHLFNCVLLS
ncbi:MAG TPA: hypothetical protein V6D22_07500 [Candidatus Obscuribacterales bacterium]